MNILLVNDDGVSARGLHSLKNRLIKEGHKVYVVAPDSQQSCQSQAITLRSPLRAQKYIYDNVECYGITGTPADCVFMGVLEFYKDVKFDLIISGINLGANVGFDINYSGTLGSAREALSYGIPGLATSLFTHDLDADFSVACDWTLLVINKLFECGFKDNTVYNLNTPYVKKEDISGLVVSHMSGVRYFSGVEKRIDPYGRDYYFITGKLFEYFDKDTDSDMLGKNYVTLTPLTVDYTDYDECNKLKKIFNP
ncbi:MAG: 5'/3'-nucleotidase SurE [Abditibacteriota bacterium]|nr:5'/3'-nucleotidase SurE [Abditibacteriota bacterium]